MSKDSHDLLARFVLQVQQTLLSSYHSTLQVHNFHSRYSTVKKTIIHPINSSMQSVKSTRQEKSQFQKFGFHSSGSLAKFPQLPNTIFELIITGVFGLRLSSGIPKRNYGTQFLRVILHRRNRLESTKVEARTASA
jgi:hypothetical protein